MSDQQDINKRAQEDPSQNTYWLAQMKDERISVMRAGEFGARWLYGHGDVELPEIDTVIGPLTGAQMEDLATQLIATAEKRREERRAK